MNAKARPNAVDKSLRFEESPMPRWVTISVAAVWMFLFFALMFDWF